MNVNCFFASLHLGMWRLDRNALLSENGGGNRYYPVFVGLQYFLGFITKGAWILQEGKNKAIKFKEWHVAWQKPQEVDYTYFKGCAFFFLTRLIILFYFQSKTLP